MVRGVRMLNNIASRVSLGTHTKEEGRGKFPRLFSPYSFDHLQCVKPGTEQLPRVTSMPSLPW